LLVEVFLKNFERLVLPLSSKIPLEYLEVEYLMDSVLVIYQDFYESMLRGKHSQTFLHL
jgi:hypothetical protein